MYLFIYVLSAWSGKTFINSFLICGVCFFKAGVFSCWTKRFCVAPVNVCRSLTSRAAPEKAFEENVMQTNADTFICLAKWALNRLWRALGQQLFLWWVYFSMYHPLDDGDYANYEKITVDSEHQSESRQHLEALCDVKCSFQSLTPSCQQKTAESQSFPKSLWQKPWGKMLWIFQPSVCASV